MQISIIVPAREERENLLLLVPQILQLKNVAEVIVVDDASGDGTVSAIQRESWSKDSRFQFLRNTKREGLAASIWHGISNARSEYCLVRDPNLSHDPEQMCSMIEACEKGYELVVASRYRGRHAWRRSSSDDLLGFYLNQILRARYPRISDWTLGYFAVRRELLLGKHQLFYGRGEYTLRLYDELLKKPELRIHELSTKGKSRSANSVFQYGPAYLNTLRNLQGMGKYYRVLLRRYTRMLQASGYERFGREARYKLLREAKILNPRAKVLDLACGDGAFLGNWCKQEKLSWDIHGRDVSSAALENALTEHSYKSVRQEDLLLSKDFTGGPYDLVVCAEFLQYVPRCELKDFLEKCHSALRKDGRLVILVPNRDSKWHHLRSRLLGVKSREYRFPHTLKELRQATEDGFTEEHVRGVNYVTGSVKSATSQDSFSTLLVFRKAPY